MKSEGKALFSIGITTFERRFSLLKDMVESIKKINQNIEIIITVNGKVEKDNNQDYLNNIYRLAGAHPHIYVFNFPRFTGLSKMWNTIVLNSSAEYNLILNDDLQISSLDFIDKINELIIKSKTSFIKINGSFCHFLITKKMLNDLNYFDERLLAFGEEDGDMAWKYESKFKKKIPALKIKLFNNIGEGYGLPHEEIEVVNLGGVNRPVFNRKVLYEELYSKNILGVRGMFDFRMRKNNEEKQYPYEKFKMDNYEKLKKWS